MALKASPADLSKFRDEEVDIALATGSEFRSVLVCTSTTVMISVLLE